MLADGCLFAKKGNLPCRPDWLLRPAMFVGLNPTIIIIGTIRTIRQTIYTFLNSAITTLCHVKSYEQISPGSCPLLTATQHPVRVSFA
jgi:hypothetical protein